MLLDAFIRIRDFFEAGGDVLWAVLAVTILMWTLMIERLWFLMLILPEQARANARSWHARDDTVSWHAKKVRARMISELSVEAHRYLFLIRSLMAVLPLLGLLGTVTGMIVVFEVMAVTGTGNARAMAGGVSAATIPTMSGLVAALSGLYLGNFLQRRADTEVERAADAMSHH